MPELEVSSCLSAHSLPPLYPESVLRGSRKATLSIEVDQQGDLAQSKACSRCSGISEKNCSVFKAVKSSAILVFTYIIIVSVLHC